MKIYRHGENSITYTLFTTLTDLQLARLLSRNVIWTHPVKVVPRDIQTVHIFPNFGSRYGYGAPDTIIITKDLVIYVEVELADFSKRKYPTPFTKQMGRFVNLANDLKEATITRLVKTFEGESGYKFYGHRRLRRLFRHIKETAHRPAFLVISSGRDVDVNTLATSIGIPRDIPLGWISYHRLKKMKGISSVARVINHNLEK